MELEHSRILVTGAAGFIGSTLCEKLIEDKCEVIGLDNFNEYYLGKEKNLVNLESNSKFSLIRGDISDHELILKLTKDIDVIFHLAAQPGVRFSLENPVFTNKINTEGTLNILNAGWKNNVKKIINASSSSLYGNPDYTPVDENHPLHPISIYGISKLAAEKYCQIYSKIHNLYTVSLRFHTVYGPRGRPDMAVFKWIDAIFKNEPIILFGDGTQTRDMTYVDDIVQGTINAAKYPAESGDVFNLASGKRISMNYVIETLFKIIGEKSEIEYHETRKDDAKDTHANIDKANKILSYFPKTTVEDGLKNTVLWYKKQFI